jgi:hypothetical protein
MRCQKLCYLDHLFNCPRLQLLLQFVFEAVLLEERAVDLGQKHARYCTEATARVDLFSIAIFSVTAVAGSDVFETASTSTALLFLFECKEGNEVAQVVEKEVHVVLVNVPVHCLVAVEGADQAR